MELLESQKLSFSERVKQSQNNNNNNNNISNNNNNNNNKPFKAS